MYHASVEQWDGSNTQQRSMTANSFVVVLIDHTEVNGHTEYIFHVGHANGSSWRVQRRFSDLLAAHRKLAKKLVWMPQFPAKSLPGLGVILGQDLLRERKAALQKYFQDVLASEVVQSADFQRLMLGVQRPEAIVALRPQHWLPGTQAQVTATVVLHVAAADAGQGGQRLVEQFVACVLPRTRGAAGGRAPLGEPLLVRGLPCGEEVAIEVRAQNGVGFSQPVMIRLLAPGRRWAPLAPGMHVRAIWAGDGNSYDATVQRVLSDGTVVVNWLRPSPLSEEPLTCVIESGGDDTTHRYVSRDRVETVLAEEEGSSSAEGEQAEAPSLLTEAPIAEGQKTLPCCKETTMLQETEVGEEEPAIFRLTVHLAEGVALLEWRQSEEVPSRVDALLEAHKLKAVLRLPLLQCAAEMEVVGKRAGTVDVVDLL